MKHYLLISAVVLGMAAHVQAQAEPFLAPKEPDPSATAGAPQTVPAPKSATTATAKPGNSGFSFVGGEAPITPPEPAKINVILTAKLLRDNFAEIEAHLGSLTVAKGAAKPVMPNMIFSEDAREASMSGSLRLQGVSPVQALALACAAAGCSMEPIFAPAEGAVSSGQTQQVIGYRIVRESAQKVTLMTAPKRVATELPDAKINRDIAAARSRIQSMKEKLSASHPSVIAAEKDLIQMFRSIESASVTKKRSIPSIVRGRLLDKDGKPLGKKNLAFYVKDGTDPTALITDGPTSDDGTFQFELPVDKQWQAVFRENDKSPGLRSEAMLTPIADRTSGEPNYDLELRVEGARLEASLKPVVGGIGVALSKRDDGVVVGAILPGSPVSAYPEIKPGQRILGVAELGKPTVDTTNTSVENLVALLRGAPGTSVNVTFGIDSDKGPKKHTVQLVRAGLPIPAPKVTALGFDIGIVPGMDSSGGGDIGFTTPQTASNTTTSGLPLLMDNERQTVRVYALRGILGEGKDYGRKQEACEVLINEALQQAGVDKTKESPRLSFHQDSRVLLVKATAAQQEIILQIIEALKENEIQPVQKAGELKEKPSELTPEVIKPPGR